MLGIYVAGDSGGFLNPAITFCFCLYRGLPWRRFPIYLLAQFLGGFVAAGVIYGNYITGIDNYEGVGVRTGRFSVLTHLYLITSSWPHSYLERIISGYIQERRCNLPSRFLVNALIHGSDAGIEHQFLRLSVWTSTDPLTHSTVPPSPTATAGIFCTYPQQFLGKTNQFFSEFITATLLMFVIFALKDESNRGAMGKTGAGPFFRRLFNPFTFFRWAADVQDHSPRTVFPDIRARRVF